MPNAIGIIGTTYPPGRMRNFVLGSFGATGPLAGYIAGIVGGLIFENSSCKWLFIFMRALPFEAQYVPCYSLTAQWYPI